MRRRAAAALLAALAAVLAISAAGSSATAPNLRTATSVRRHVVVTFTLTDLVPGRILVATKRAVRPSGRFVAANIRVNELLRTTKSGSGYKARTKHTLRPGTYYVEISGSAIGTDCIPGKPCRQTWSNVLRVIVRRR